MAINKELYERYKAMKAAKLEENSALNENKNYNKGVETSQISNTGNGFADLSKAQTSAANITHETGENISSYTNSQQISAVTENLNPIQKHTPDILKFALIGYPLGHSLSKYIHDAGFKSIGQNATYEILETKPEDLVDRVKYLRSHGYRGFNVTIPLKLPITMFLDDVDASANVVNAINTVYIDPKTNYLKGYNTDVEGFRNSIPKDISLYNKTAAILGTGGAARAAISALVKEQIKTIKVYTRNVANSVEFMGYLRKTYPSIEFGAYQIDRIRDLSDIDILVNATPIGMQGYAYGYTPIEEKELQTLPGNSLVYDVIYNPKQTLLIKLAKKHNYRTVNGMDMLVNQALEAQKIWTGHIPDFKDMKIAALENI